MRLVFAAALPLLMLPAPAMAATLTNMLAMEGSCQQLTIADEDLSDDCHTSIIQMLYDDGRVGLYVSATGAGKLYSFSGFDGEPDGALITQDLDQIILSPEVAGGEAIQVLVSGRCTYENPYEGEAKIECLASDKKRNEYRFEFTTNGNPPEEQM